MTEQQKPAVTEEEKPANIGVTLDGQEIDLDTLTPEERNYFDMYQTVPKMSEILQKKVQGKRTRFDSADWAKEQQQTGKVPAEGNPDANPQDKLAQLRNKRLAQLRRMQ
eukprot:TRINITY_DN12130_c0_g1_i1.p2 TRINITY_DN12130_c0_g1~~TRINITY_DN12130_c0_g1_i1.p2  ORF type:complete len:121 (+),score=34.19 TRINITY_DN12130_c0_g1_i1:38-364(+)